MRDLPREVMGQTDGLELLFVEEAARVRSCGCARMTNSIGEAGRKEVSAIRFSDPPFNTLGISLKSFFPESFLMSKC